MITAQILGAGQALARLRVLPDAANSAVARTIGNLGSELQQRVQDELSGQSLQSRSGKLRSTIDLAIDQTPAATNAVVSTDLDYGRAQEFGFTGVVGVRASLRRIRKAFGRSISEKASNVRAYRRRFDLPGRSFLDSALDETTPDIGPAIDAALQEAMLP